MKKRIGNQLLGAIGICLIYSAIYSPSAIATQPSKSSKPISAVYLFKGNTTNGKNFNGAELAGRPAVLWFWAPWCTICRGESPDLVALANSFKGKVRIIGVAGLGPIKDMKQFITDTHTSNIVHLADTDGAIWLHFQIPAQPAFVFLTAKGSATRQIGALSKSDLFSMTRQLLKKT